jgi:Domain of unknown function (DUF5076)
MSTTYQALNIPPAGNQHGGLEVLRCAVIDGELHLTFRPAFNETGDWGRMFAEVARQVARAYAQQDRSPEPETLKQISAAFAQELRAPTNTDTAVGPIETT